MAGGAISDSEGAKIGGMAAGLIAASQAYGYLENNGEKAIREAYEQGKREARTEISNAYWHEAIGADGSEYEKSRKQSCKIRLIKRKPHIYKGAIYGE